MLVIWEAPSKYQLYVWPVGTIAIQPNVWVTSFLRKGSTHVPKEIYDIEMNCANQDVFLNITAHFNLTNNVPSMLVYKIFSYFQFRIILEGQFLTV